MVIRQISSAQEAIDISIKQHDGQIQDAYYDQLSRDQQQVYKRAMDQYKQYRNVSPEMRRIQEMGIFGSITEKAPQEFALINEPKGKMGFITKDGRVIGGKLGEAMAKNDPIKSLFINKNKLSEASKMSFSTYKDISKDDIAMMRDSGVNEFGAYSISLAPEKSFGQKVGDTVKGEFGRIVRRGKEVINDAPTGSLLDIGRIEILKEPTLKPTAPEGYIDTSTERSFVKSGRGTMIVNPSARQKTFFENYGLDPNDSDAIELENKMRDVQSRYDQGLITQEQGNRELERASNYFEGKKVRQGIPKQFAIGAAAGVAARFIPGVGQVIGGLSLIESFLQRKELASQSKRIGLTTTIASQGAALAGGITGAAIGGRVKGVFTESNKVNLKLGEIDTKTTIVGSEKVKLINRAGELINPELKSQIQAGKITDITAYKIVSRDGRVFQILEFTRQTSGAVKGGVKGTKEFYGLELKTIDSKPTNIAGFKRKSLVTGDTIIGRGVSVSKDGVTDTYIRAFKFKPQGRLGRVLNPRGRGMEVEIAERSKQISSIGNIKASVSKVESEARVLSTKRISKELSRQLVNLKKKFTSGNKLNVREIKRIVNIERRFNGEKPFTEAEFRKGILPTLSEAVILRTLNRASATETRIPGGIIQRIKSKESFGGKIKTTSIIERTKLKKSSSRTPFSYEKVKKPKVYRKPGIKSYNIKSKKESSGNGALAQEEPTMVGGAGKGVSLFKGTNAGSLAIAALAEEEAALTSTRFGLGIKGSKIARFGIQKLPDYKIKSERVLPPVLKSSLIQEQTQRTKVINKLKYIQLVKSPNKEGTKIYQVPGIRSEERTKENVGQRLRIRQLQAQEQRQRLKVRQLQKPITIRVTQLPRPKPVPTITRIPEVSSENKNRIFRRLKNYKPGYDVYNRQGKKLTKTPLTYKSALGLGFKKTDVSIKASFFIRPSNSKGQTSKTLERTAMKLAPMFRSSKRVKGLIVEREKFRLSTGLEKKQIQQGKKLKAYSFRRKR